MQNSIRKRSLLGHKKKVSVCNLNAPLSLLSLQAVRDEITCGIEGFILTMADVTKRKLAEEELIRTQKALVQSSRLSDVGMLAATIAHELRNPLAAIRIAAFNIKRKAQNSH